MKPEVSPSRIERIDQENTALRKEFVRITEALHSIDTQLESPPQEVLPKPGFIERFRLRLFPEIGLISQEDRLEQLARHRKMDLTQEQFAKRIDLMRINTQVKQHRREHELEYFNAALINAHADGVTITTEYSDALNNALWQKEHIGADEDPMDPLRVYDIPSLTQEDLAENLSRYPEMSWDIPSEELEKARDIVKHIPLFHTTTPESTLLDANGRHNGDAILSHERLLHEIGSDPERSVRTLTFEDDIALGLNQYIFMTMGKPYPRNDDGDVIFVMQSDLLNTAGCIVTPDDMANCKPKESCNDEAHPALIDSVKEYRSLVVSGAGWLEIIARRIARFAQENPGQDFPIQHCFTFGEIKFQHAVPGSSIVDTIQDWSDSVYAEEADYVTL